ncbi:glycosyltransferase [uncultured Lacinutrix sp.]|uniref:glycosyltransferase family 4 protein n=1 Tax=uncultured Lacinutrix sp. TaxID=574032 RepID=UPI0026113323|nr:glycosyltransferase [uncultured Lacinutrix sp.]
MKNLLYIGNKLSKTGKTVTTIETLSANFVAEGFKVKSVSSIANKWFRFLDMLFAVIRYSKWADYVLIDTYSTQNFYYAYATSQLCRFFKLKYLPILHGGNLPKRLENSPKFSQAIFKNAYINIAPSKYTQDAFKNQNINNVSVIPNSIILKNYTFKPREINTVKLLWVRSFSKLYNPKLAIDILNKLKHSNIESELCMVGPDNDGSLEETKQYAEELKLDVNFTGRLSKKEWIDLSKKSNVFINTTNFDNMPVSVIETMALGLPVVSTNVGGLPYLINNNVNGVMVPANDADAFVEAILNLKNNTKVTTEMIKNARKTAEQFQWHTVKEKWKNTLS